jgi:TonB-linked SusC/RagA family outer membrane protein
MLASVCFLLLGAISAYAQGQPVTGKILDAGGAPLPGVSILIKGTTTGTTTDIEGLYSLAASPADVLVVSFIGYKTQEATVGNQTQISFTMEEDISTLQEVVVVGYGVQKKALNTGANLQVGGDDLKKLSTTNALQALQGQAPGVQITSTSGQPGSSMNVIIRGMGTNNGAGPLYVVDGVLTGDVSYLNNGDIESITVLKDAASAAIYGSQSANGVVLITTRSGKKNTNAQITFDAFYGVQNVARKIKTLDSQQYASIMNEGAINSGKAPYFTNDQIAAMDKGTDWIDQMFVKDAVTQNYSIGASGGSEASVYSTSLSYLSQEGVVGGKDLSNYKRYNFRINSEHKLYKDVVTLGQNLNFAYIENNGVAVGNQYSNTLRAAFNTSPFVPVYDALGNFYDNSNSTWNTGEANPYALMVYNNQNKSASQKLVGNVYAQVEPVKNLKFRTSLGIDYFSSDNHSFTPVYKLSAYAYNDFTKVTQYMGKGTTWIWDNLVSYGFNVNEHQIDVMAGTSTFKFTDNSITAGNSDLVFSNLDQAWLSGATNKSNAARISLTGGPNDLAIENRQSFFGRVNYNFRETYLFNATFRADGSSKFAPGHQWGYFPSVSAGWVITNEPFLQGSDWLSSFKLRASWGQVGNQRVDGFQYVADIKLTNTNYSFGDKEGTLTPGAYQNRLSNPNLSWETSEQTNIGFDARFLSGRLNVNFDLYSKKTKDLIVLAPILATAGANAPFINGGDVTNKGVELGLSYNNKVGDLSYTVNANGAYNQNKVSNIATADGIVHGLINQLFDNSLEFYRMQNGYPIGYFWGLQTAGIFQTEEQVNAYRSGEGKIIQPTAQPGDVIYVDRDGNGVIDNGDRTNIGSPVPDFTFGFSISANYHGFDLGITANGVAGNQIVQSYRNQSSAFSNYTTAILDRWHGPGSSNTMPRITENNSNWTSFSDLYIHNGDFLRISNVTVGYDLMKLLDNKFASQFRIYCSALNLLTLTKYTGMDPEIGYGVDPMSSGIDLGYYPRPRTFMVGVNVKF